MTVADVIEETAVRALAFQRLAADYAQSACTAKAHGDYAKMGALADLAARAHGNASLLTDLGQWIQRGET